MGDILQIQIQNSKTKEIRTIPLKFWENGQKSDPEWDVFSAPKPKVVAEKPVVVELKKPVPAPVAPPAPAPAIKPVKPVAKPIVKPKRKGK